MRVTVEGYVITVRKIEGKIGSFEFLVLGDGKYQQSSILRVVGDGIKPSLTEKVRIEIVQRQYIDKKTGKLNTYWRKADTPLPQKG